MRTLPCSILLLLGRRQLATPASGVFISASPCLRSFTATAAPPRCCWRRRPRARARGDLPPSAPPNRPVRRVCGPVSQAKFRFHNGSRRSMASTTGIKGEDLGGVHDRDNKHARKKVTGDIFLPCGHGPPGGELIDGDEFESLEDEPFFGNYYNFDEDRDEDVGPMNIIPYSRHRDGSIYRGAYSWKTDYCIADRNETRFEATMLSNPKAKCLFHGATSVQHSPRHMLQFISLKLAKIQMEGGPVELYGYIAARDILDPLLNYVVNFNRVDPILVEQGSLIEMSGPKRGIEFYFSTLIEYDMRIKAGKEEKDDLQLIDGVSIINETTIITGGPYAGRIHGDHGAVDITLSRVDSGVEATVEVIVSEVRSNFNLCVGCFISGLDEEIRLFDSTISESRGLRRSVVAVEMDTWMDLKLRVGSGPCYNSDFDAEHCYTFKATNHGYTSQLVKAKLAMILVKVTWSTLSMST